MFLASFKGLIATYFRILFARDFASFDPPPPPNTPSNGGKLDIRDFHRKMSMSAVSGDIDDDMHETLLRSIRPAPTIFPLKSLLRNLDTSF